MILHTNWFPQAHISYKPTQIISPLNFVTWTPTSHYKYNSASYPMQKLHSIYYDNYGCIHNYQHTHISMDCTTKMLLLYTHLELELSPPINHMHDPHGHHMANQDGI